VPLWQDGSNREAHRSLVTPRKSQRPLVWAEVQGWLERLEGEGVFSTARAAFHHAHMSADRPQPPAMPSCSSMSRTMSRTMSRPMSRASSFDHLRQAGLCGLSARYCSTLTGTLDWLRIA
jgi:hypothetical protein